MGLQEVDTRRGLTTQRKLADDLDFVEIIMAIEEQCDIAIPDSDLPESADGITVDQLARLVDRKLSGR